MKQIYINCCKKEQKNTQINSNNKNIVSGEVQEEGIYKCCNCGQKIYLDHKKELPNCPKCNCRFFEVE